MDVAPVSVVIAAYRQPVLLRRALAGVAAQRLRPAEVIVVDDASGDETPQIAAALGARVVRHDRNTGSTGARNTGIAAATQPWIAMLDHDDQWLPQHLEHVWSLRGEHVLAAASALRHGAHGRRPVLNGPLARSPVVLRSPAPLLHPCNFIPFSATLVRTDVVREAGGFRQQHGVADLDLWIRVLARGTAIVSPTVTVLYCVHERQVSRDVAMMQAAHLSVSAACAGNPWWSADLVERWRATAEWNNVRSAVRRRRVGEAFRHARIIAGHPQRVRGVAEMWVHRLRLRRRSARVARRALGSA